MSKFEPTGRRRYRLHGIDYVKVLVLQIEERGFVPHYTAGHVDCTLVSRWRDATLEDISVDAWRAE